MCRWEGGIPEISGTTIYQQFFLCQVRLARGYMDSLCMDGAAVSKACMCSNTMIGCAQLAGAQIPCSMTQQV